MPSPTPLYQIEECPDLYVDACVCDEQCNLVFLSAWGRDTVTQEFLARLTLGREENGIDHFHIIVDGRRLPVFPNQDLLEKRTTRQFRGTLFGSLLNLWLFDRRASAPDRGNHLAFALLQRCLLSTPEALAAGDGNLSAPPPAALARAGDGGSHPAPDVDGPTRDDRQRLRLATRPAGRRA